jgi:glycosyltransferase involved in cell wall biosynthesis
MKASNGRFSGMPSRSTNSRTAPRALDGYKRALLISTVAQSLVFQSPSITAVIEKNGYEVHFAAGNDKWTRYLDQSRYHPLAFHRRSLRGIIRAAVEIRRLLEEQWAMVQVQTPVAALLVRLLASRERAFRLVYVAHGYQASNDSRPAAKAVFLWLERQLSRNLDALVLVAGEDFVDASRVGIDKVCAVYRIDGAGIDIAPGVTTGSGLLDRRMPRFVFCGDLNRNKDPRFAISVVSAYRRLFGTAELVLIGDGPLADEVGREGRRFPWLNLIPYTPDVLSVFRSSDCLLSPSYREGLPRVVVEALGCGLPVVARSNRGSREVLRDGIGQVMDRTASPEDWAVEMRLAVSKGPSAAVAARQVAGLYSVDRVAFQYQGVLCDLGLAASE